MKTVQLAALLLVHFMAGVGLAAVLGLKTGMVTVGPAPTVTRVIETCPKEPDIIQNIKPKRIIL